MEQVLIKMYKINNNKVTLIPPHSIMYKLIWKVKTN
jgi:hypothetical protein